jgi:hypothetical protein
MLVFISATRLQHKAENVVQSDKVWVAFQVPTVPSEKMTVLWDIAPYSLVKTDRSFRGAYCLYLQGNGSYRTCPYAICFTFSSLLLHALAPCIQSVTSKLRSMLHHHLSAMSVTLDIMSSGSNVLQLKFRWQEEITHTANIKRLIDQLNIATVLRRNSCLTT